jgi:molybdopterin converting factor small subunit
VFKQEKTDGTQMPINDETTVNDVIDYIRKEYPDINFDKGSSLITVNHEIVPLTKVLQANDTVSLFPPIGGG